MEGLAYGLALVYFATTTRNVASKRSHGETDIVAPPAQSMSFRDAGLALPFDWPVSNEMVRRSRYARRAPARGCCCLRIGRRNVVFLPELTLSRYPADTRPQTAADRTPESLLDGPTFDFTRKAAVENQVYVQASLYEAVDRADGLGFNTAILVNPTGDLVAKTRKLHIPVTEGYFEDHYFAEGPSESPYPVHSVPIGNAAINIGLPTCWDEWFPEVARSYGLRGADILSYPTAIGSEPDHPNFNTRPCGKK